MTLLNGLILGLGGLLLAIPIILHFLMQPKPKLMTFPALKFIQKKQIKNRRQMRVRHIVLLLCLLYTSPSPRDATLSRMPSSA